MRVGINIDGQFKPMTGIQHSIDSLIHHLYLNQGQNSANPLWAFASSLPSENYVDDYARDHPGTFEWRGLPQAQFDTKNENVFPTLVPAKFERDHPWLSWKIHERERKLYRKRINGPEVRVQNYDVFHCPEPGDLQFLNYQPKKAVATLYDIATRRFTSAYTPVDISVWERYFDFAFHRCAHVVAISEATKQDCMEAFGLSSDRITVTPLAARASAKHMADGPKRRELLSKWELTDTPYVLYTGTLEPRKNLHRLVKAFSEVIRQNPALPHKLVLAGGNWERMDIELRIHAIECGIPGRLITTGYVSNEQLNALMSGCEAFAYVSLYEGFGMPPLEAMVCGAPVITSNVSSLPEVVGDAGVQVDPLNTQEIAHALHLLMTDADENARRRELSAARAKLFTWERTARLTMEAYQKAALS